MLKYVLILVLVTNNCYAEYLIHNNHFGVLKEIFAWNQIGYDFDGIKYIKDTNHEIKKEDIFFQEELEENEMYFKQYNNVPIGFELYKDRVFITVPRRRFGIISTLNYVDLKSSSPSPLLKPYPNTGSVSSLVSIYRPRVDACARLWAVDTGLIEIPDNITQKKPPQIIVYDLKTDKEILRYDIPSDVIVNGTTSGLTSITVDVTSTTCDDAYAYINDLRNNGLIVFSLKQRSSWRFSHETFSEDDGASGFKIANIKIKWQDGLFSVALSDPDKEGRRTAYYHPFIATQEFSISTHVLKNKSANFEENYKLEGVRGVWSQSGSHDFHSATKTLLFANVAQDGIMCWNTQIPLTSKMAAVVAQEHKKLIYISDLKVIGDDVWLLVNRMPRFIYAKLKPSEKNFYLYRGKVEDLIKGTVCEKKA